MRPISLTPFAKLCRVKVPPGLAPIPQPPRLGAVQAADRHLLLPRLPRGQARAAPRRRAQRRRRQDDTEVPGEERTGREASDIRRHDRGGGRRAEVDDVARAVLAVPLGVDGARAARDGIG